MILAHREGQEQLQYMNSTAGTSRRRMGSVASECLRPSSKGASQCVYHVKPLITIVELLERNDAKYIRERLLLLPIIKMKPVVGVMQAWFCIVVSIFAIVILSVIGALFKSKHHSMVGGTDDPDPKDGAAVAATIFSAVVVYAVFLVGCGFQAYLHYRDNRRGAVRL
ncbi:hypothetical protein B7494_g8114 [Chlorociboria aeruginascens]|nr:hypothetical protein B7494_g8114 [Chlorociboria aeruginascens]